jgi:hypothetical protein
MFCIKKILFPPKFEFFSFGKTKQEMSKEMSLNTPVQRSKLNDITNKCSPEQTPRSKMTNLKRGLELATEEQNQITPKKPRHSIARVDTKMHYLEGFFFFRID